MRRRLVRAISTITIFSLLFASFYHHVLRDVLPRNHGLRSLNHPLGHTQNYVVSESYPSNSHHDSTPPPLEAVLLPDWEVLVFIPGPNSDFDRTDNISCLFRGGVESPARFAGALPSTERGIYRCELPRSLRSARRFYVPVLAPAGSRHGTRGVERSAREMSRWNRIVYEAVSMPDDVIVFAKGVNTRQGVNRPAADIRCVFVLGGGAAVANTTVSVSAQEVFRCAHPDPKTIPAAVPLRVSLHLKGETGALPSFAPYHPPSPAAHDTKLENEKSLVCACTMIFNVAKFLREWVTYHSAIGVQRFILYDNGSEDELDSAVTQLNQSGYNISTTIWPWPKTQEAGFSHCAVAHQHSCTWMAYLDVDEFLFSPSWASSTQPNNSMVRSLLPTNPVEDRVGQVSFPCLDFGPSGLTQHPSAGVTQGYTCRRRVVERHKSLVLVEAEAGRSNASLVNAVHHFSDLWDAGWRTENVPRGSAAVFHYKYQAWAEFRAKFRRRVSAYVVDWRVAVNPKSKDRTPGLGFKAVEPEGWQWRFCEVNDSSLVNVTRSWFGTDGPQGEHKLAWEA